MQSARLQIEHAWAFRLSFNIKKLGGKGRGRRKIHRSGRVCDWAISFADGVRRVAICGYGLIPGHLRRDIGRGCR